MIAAFPERASIEAGETLVLHVRSDSASATRMRVVRCGARDVAMTEHHGRTLEFERGTWQRVPLRIPPEWRSGVYVAAFDDGAPSGALDARSGRALFVVRARVPSSAILFNVPLFTYHAYNVGHDDASEGTCLYNGASRVSLRRAGGGIGGRVWSAFDEDAYDASSPRQSFAHWDLPAIRWLERRANVDYCCDLDLHDDRARLDVYRLLLAFGHHEYWTDAMRSALDEHLARGRNAAFFTGNTCWFRIGYDRASDTISRIPGRWNDDPEERTFGVSYRFGGGKWRGARPPSGFVVRDATHWSLEGTGARDGDVFGDAARVVGYECDGAPAWSTIHTIADASLAGWFVADGSGEINDAGRATLGIVERRGSLFIAGTVDWPRALASGEPIVERITENVIRRFAEHR